MILEEIVKIFLSLLVGAIIGSEREKRHKPVGIRTIALVSVGATLAIIVSVKYLPNDSGRIFAGILTGLGFLGAGAIMSEGHNVRGLTTATTIWSSAIIGIVIGLGDYLLGLLTGLIIYSMLKLHKLEDT